MDAKGHQSDCGALRMQAGNRSGQADDDSSTLSSLGLTSRSLKKGAPAGPHRRPPMSSSVMSQSPQSPMPTIQESRGDAPPGQDTAKRIRSSPDPNSERRDSHSYVIGAGSVKHLTSHRTWPAQREARGLLTIKASPNHGKSLRTECSLQHGLLMLSIAQALRESSSGESSGSVVVATIPVEELAVGLQRGRTDMFIIATRYRNKLYDDIACFADDQEKRNKWIAVFRRMGVPIFDLSDGSNTESPPVVF
jgi:hypothetical protein